MNIELMKQIAAELPGWELSFNDDQDIAYLSKHGMRMTITIPQDRIYVQTWVWPRYLSYNDGSPVYETITPRCVSESVPSISVSATRSARAVAGEISRRFIPAYERVWNLCAVKACSNGDYEREKRANWLETCAVIGKFGRDNAYLDVVGVDWIHVKQNGKHARLEADLTPAQLKKVLEALRG